MSPDRDSNGQQTVLIAEDDEELVTTIQEFAEALGLRAIVAEDGQRAIELCDAYHPLVCFFDMLLPKMSGFEACTAIKAQGGKNAPVVIMMSGIISDASMVSAEMKESGADDFVTKPFPLVRLCEVIALRVPSLAKAAMRLHQERSGGDALDSAPSRPSRPSRPAVAAPAAAEASRAAVPAKKTAVAESRAARRRAAKPATPPKKVTLRSHKILVVEDSADLRAIYADFARRLGLKVVEAATGPAALEVFEAESPDLCLIDLLLPGMNGMEVCREIKSRNAQTVVVAMSAVYRNMDSLTKDLEQYQADDYIHKPFGLTALRELLEGRLPKGTLGGDADASLRFSVEAGAKDVGGHLSTMLTPRGALGSPSFASLLFRARARGFSGALEIERDGVIRTIHFVGGTPVHARSSSSEEGLEAVLVRQGLVKLNDLNEIVLHADYTGMLAEELLRENLVRRDDLERAAHDTVREVMLSCFRLDGGQFEFFEGDHEGVDVEVPTNPVALIAEGVLKALSQNQVAQRLGDMVQHYALRTPWFEKFRDDFPTQGDEDKFLDAIDGDATLSQLMGKRILEMNQTLGVIWALYQARMIVFSEQPGHRYSRSNLVPPAAMSAPIAEVNTGQPALAPSGPVPPAREDSLSLWSQLFGASSADF